MTKEDFEVNVELGLLLTPLRSGIEREIISFCNEHLAGKKAGRDQATPRAGRRRKEMPEPR